MKTKYYVSNIFSLFIQIFSYTVWVESWETLEETSAMSD